MSRSAFARLLYWPNIEWIYTGEEENSEAIGIRNSRPDIEGLRRPFSPSECARAIMYGSDMK